MGDGAGRARRRGGRDAAADADQRWGASRCGWVGCVDGVPRVGSEILQKLPKLHARIRTRELWKTSGGGCFQRHFLDQPGLHQTVKLHSQEHTFRSRLATQIYGRILIFLRRAHAGGHVNCKTLLSFAHRSVLACSDVAFPLSLHRPSPSLPTHRHRRQRPKVPTRWANPAPV